MGKVYNIGEDRNDPKNLIATKDYVDGVAKQISGIIVNHVNNPKAHDVLERSPEIVIDGSYSIDGFPYPEMEISSYSENNDTISTDTLAELKNRPTSIEVSQLIANATDRVKKDFDDTINKIINDSGGIRKLKDLVAILSNTESTKLLDDILKDKISRDNLEAHSNNGTHITNRDRDALNILRSLAEVGFMDWDAKEGEVNFIMNKPTSMPANGGNADTVGGYSPEDMVNKNTHDLIIGAEDNNYPLTSVDLYVEKSNENCGYIKLKIEDFHGGNIFFRNGIYRLNDIDLVRGRSPLSNDLILAGNKNNSIFYDTNFKLEKVTIKDLYFEKCTIILKNNNTIKDCEFVDCNIIFDIADGNLFTTNILNHCTVQGSGICMHNILTFNRLIGIDSINYIGPENIIEGNIKI